MSLFPSDRPAQAARLAPRLRELAEQGVYFGTSSWKYEGWLGAVYSRDRYITRGKHSKKKFEESCLAEYAEVFPTVCGAFAFYRFPSEDYWSRLFGLTPTGFLWGLKVPEDITVATWPGHARYGQRAGQDNDAFLGAKTFAHYFADRLAPHEDRLGPLIFQFGTFNKTTFPTPADFLARLGPFLAALPEGFRYAVEIRNSDYLTPGYFGVLARHNVAHCFNAWTRMPELIDQASLDDAYTADFTVIRALLKKGRTYEIAVSKFEPYEGVQEPVQDARDGMIEIARRTKHKRVPTFLFVNNRLEGHAPSTIEAVTAQL